MSMITSDLHIYSLKFSTLYNSKYSRICFKLNSIDELKTNLTNNKTTGWRYIIGERMTVEPMERKSDGEFECVLTAGFAWVEEAICLDILHLVSSTWCSSALRLYQNSTLAWITTDFCL